MTADDSGYTFGAYLRDRWAVLLVGAVCLAAVFGMLLVLGAGQGAALVTAFIAVCDIVALAVEYRRRAAFYRELSSLMRSVSHAYQLPSLIDEPSFLEGREAYDALARMARISGEELGRERNDADAYRRYIELWIHEVKMPIAAAKLMLANMHGEDAAKLKGELERIESQVESALYYARSTSVENDYFIRDVPIGSIVAEACKRNAHLLIERGVTPRIDIGGGVTVLADETWTCFIVGQIVVNAAKYGAREIRFATRTEGEGTASCRTVLEIADDGDGIPAADVPRVFERGFTGENGRASGSSTGMGLYLVATMCEKLGLGVAIASEEGAGTRVMIAFPQDRRRLDAGAPGRVAS